MTSSSEGPGGSDASEILAGIWLLSTSVLEESAPALEAMGLSPKTFFLLSTVTSAPFPAELARAMHLPPPTVTYMLKQLESLGYLERRAEPGDLRKFRLIVTAAGTQAIAGAREAATTILDQRLSRLKPGEIATLARIVEKVARPDHE